MRYQNGQLVRATGNQQGPANGQGGLQAPGVMPINPAPPAGGGPTDSNPTVFGGGPRNIGAPGMSVDTYNIPGGGPDPNQFVAAGRGPAQPGGYGPGAGYPGSGKPFDPNQGYTGDGPADQDRLRAMVGGGVPGQSPMGSAITTDYNSGNPGNPDLGLAIQQQMQQLGAPGPPPQPGQSLGTYNTLGMTGNVPTGHMPIGGVMPTIDALKPGGMSPGTRAPVGGGAPGGLGPMGGRMTKPKLPDVRPVAAPGLGGGVRRGPAGAGPGLGGGGFRY